MKCRRSAVGVAALDDRIYICGGYDGSSSLSTVECYFPKTGNMIAKEIVLVRY